MEDTNDNDILLTEEEVKQVFNFADFAAGYNGWGVMGNALNPMLLNERMKQLNLNPMQATEDELTKAMNDPGASELELQSFGQDFENQSQVYKRLLSYLGNLLAFDMTYECVTPIKDYKSAAYNKDLDRVKKFFDKFDYKQEFSAVVGEMLRNESYFCCPRFDFPDRVILQELPASPQYTMITGKWGYGYLFSFNMYWFLQPGVDVDMYPDFFKTHFDRLFDGDKNLKTYRPDMAPINRGQSSWAFWQDIPPETGWMFKMNDSMAARIPYFTGLFPDLILQPTMRALQKNANLSTAARILTGEIGPLKDAQAKEKDQFNISPKLLGNFLALVKAAVGEAVKTAALPLNNVKGISFPAETDLYSSSQRTTVSNSGINSNLIFSTDQKLTTVESMLSVNTDEMLMASVYPQLCKFLEWQINRQTVTYKFNFHLSGSNFYTDRDSKFKRAMEMAQVGLVLPQLLANSVGMTPFEFQRHIDEGIETGFVDKLKPLVSAFQQSGKDAGRPQNDSSESTDAGENSRGSGANIARGGKV